MAVKLIIVLAVLLGGLALVTQYRAARNEARAEAAYPLEGQMLDVDGTSVHAVVMGDGPDVVLIHGSSGSTRDMTFALAPALAQNYRVIVLDRPGLGWTTRLNSDGASITEQAALLSAAAAQLGADSPIVVGQSYGGAVALAWAVNHSDQLSALVTLAAASHPWNTPLDTLYRVNSSTLGSILAVPLITAFVSPDRVESAVNGVFTPQNAPDGYSDHFGPSMTLRRHSLRENALQRANLLDEIRALSPLYPQITIPTEVLHGTADDTVSLKIHSEPLAQRVPGAVLTRLAGIGHMPHHVALPDVTAAIDRAASRAGLR
ncbi:MAG: alpha/beta hydrolase [Marinibacterium sp.]|nr:alpha/beta hydrolase [Marinibacterium sp.]